MIKDHIDYKLINICLISIILFLLIKTSDFWIGVVDVFMQICFPFFASFILSYALYPIFKFLRKYFSKWFSVIIIFLILVGIIFSFIFMIFPLIINQIGPVLENLIFFLKEMSLKYEINFESIFTFIYNIYDSFLEKTGNYLTTGITEVISVSIDVITVTFVIVASFGYLMFDMEKIRENIKLFLISKSKKAYNYFYGLDKEMNNYLSSFFQIIIITFFEYLLAYLLIGHPNYLVLALIAAISNLIPYFGGIIANIVAFITAFAISPNLLLKTCILWVICGIIDGYIINPLVYGRNNHLHPLIVVLAIFVGGILGGILGIILSVPVTILIIYSIKFYKKNKFIIRN